MNDDIQEILFTEEEIQQKVDELAAKINSDYEGKDLVVVGILKGAVVFMSDLLKKINVKASIDFMDISSYGNETVSTGEVKIIKDLDNSVIGKDILIVEDIIDTGNTLSYLVNNLKQRGANSVKIATLLDKKVRREQLVDIDYCGFVVDDFFVVGYGIDYAEKYRNLPFIGYLKPEVYS